MITVEAGQPAPKLTPHPRRAAWHPLRALRAIPLRSRVLLKLAFYTSIPFLALSLLLLVMSFRVAERDVLSDTTRDLDRIAEAYNLQLNGLVQRSTLVMSNILVNGLVRQQFFIDLPHAQFDVYLIYLINRGLEAMETGIDKPSVDTSCITLYLEGYAGYRGRYLESLDALSDRDRPAAGGAATDMWWRYTRRADEQHLFVSFYRNVETITGMDSVLEFRMPYQSLRRVFESFVPPREGVLAHLDEAGDVISVVPDAAPPSAAGATRHRLVSSNRMMDGSRIELRLPVSAIWRRLRTMLVLVAVGLAALVAGLLYAVSRTARQITDRVTAFSRLLARDTSILSRSGAAAAGIPARQRDELDVLEQAIASLVDELGQAHRDVVEAQASRNLVELELLQSRMNPHLLYNSLGVLKWSAMRAHDARSLDIIEALTAYYRWALARGENLTTVQEELDGVSQYLRIVNLTHADPYKLVLAVDAETLSLRILKHTLQPFVENAVLHGLKGREGKGVIEVSGRRHDGDLLFTVTDNGYGMPPETIAKIMSMSYTSRYGGYGMKNSMRRLRSYYGDGYGISIESEEGKGTTIRIRVRAESNHGRGAADA